MKKVFAALAAGAVAVSMLAFTGCGGSKTPSGAIKGDYKEKTPEEMGEIIDDVLGGILGSEDEDGSGLGGLVAVDKYNYGLKIDLSESASMGNYLSTSGSVKADFKLKSTDDGFIGAGSAKASFNQSSSEGDYSSSIKMNFEGNAYIQDLYLYAAGKGSNVQEEKYQGETDKDEESFDEKVKINLAELVSLYLGGDDVSAVDEDLSSEGSFSIIEGLSQLLTAENLLSYASEYSLVLTADTKDGVKLKLSATQDTVWKVVAQVSGMPDEAIAAYKEYVKINNFLFDVYFALDSDGAFCGASIVTDINITLKSELTSIIFGSESAEGGYAAVAAEAATTMPELKASIKGSVELYTHNDSVSVPSGLASDSEYYDVTDYILGMFGDDEDYNY